MSSRPPAQFLDLPGELRDRIYEDTIRLVNPAPKYYRDVTDPLCLGVPDLEHSCQAQWSRRREPHPADALLRVNRQIHNEVKATWLRLCEADDLPCYVDVLVVNGRLIRFQCTFLSAHNPLNHFGDVHIRLRESKEGPPYQHDYHPPSDVWIGAAFAMADVVVTLLLGGMNVASKEDRKVTIKYLDVGLVMRPDWSDSAVRQNTSLMVQACMFFLSDRDKAWPFQREYHSRTVKRFLDRLTTASVCVNEGEKRFVDLPLGRDRKLDSEDRAFFVKSILGSG